MVSHKLCFARRPQQRQWQQRVYSQPQQNFDQYRNYGQYRREQAFEANRQRALLKSERKSDREAWRFERKQQRFDSADVTALT